MERARKWTLVLIAILHLFINIDAFFTKVSWLDSIRTNQKNYGVAVSDVNHDGRPDFIVAGYSGQNFVFTYNNVTGKVKNIAEEGTPYAALRDVPGNAIGTS